MAADEGGGKPRSDAALPADADSEGTDDLDALAGGLGSIAPAEGVAASDDGVVDASDDEIPDLAALGAMTARTTLTGAEAEAEALKSVLVERVERTVASEAVLDALRPAALTSAPPPARAAWVMPLLVGIGVGVGIAGVMFGLSNHASPAVSGGGASFAAGDSTAVPAAAPPAAAAPAPAPVVAAAEAAASAPAPRPSAEATGSASATNPAPPASPAHAPALAARAAHNDSAAAPASSAGPAPVIAPVIAVHPAAEAQAPGEPDLGASVSASASDTTPKPASTSGGTAPALRGGASMDALLDEALSPKARRDELAARQQAALEADAPPPTPSRADVTQAVAVLLPAIRGCAMGQSGLATAGIVVNGDGRVASVDVAGAPFAGTASGRCMEGVLRRARFPRFTQPSFRIKYPLAIQ